MVFPLFSAFSLYLSSFFFCREGKSVCGARWNKGVVQEFDSYEFAPKSWSLTRWHFCSIDTWLQVCRTRAPRFLLRDGAVVFYCAMAPHELALYMYFTTVYVLNTVDVLYYCICTFRNAVMPMAPHELALYMYFTTVYVLYYCICTLLLYMCQWRLTNLDCRHVHPYTRARGMWR